MNSKATIMLAGMTVFVLVGTLFFATVIISESEVDAERGSHSCNPHSPDSRNDVKGGDDVTPCGPDRAKREHP